MPPVPAVIFDSGENCERLVSPTLGCESKPGDMPTWSTYRDTLSLTPSIFTERRHSDNVFAKRVVSLHYTFRISYQNRTHGMIAKKSVCTCLYGAPNPLRRCAPLPKADLGRR